MAMGPRTRTRARTRVGLSPVRAIGMRPRHLSAAGPASESWSDIAPQAPRAGRWHAAQGKYALRAGRGSGGTRQLWYSSPIQRDTTQA